MKYDDDKDALAAEYVLGTLSSDERDQAEAMLAIDPGFEAAVRQWERRLGELNVMVEAVEPRPQVWDRIKVGLGHQGAGHEDAGHEDAGQSTPNSRCRASRMLRRTCRTTCTSPKGSNSRKRITRPSRR